MEQGGILAIDRRIRVSKRKLFVNSGEIYGRLTVVKEVHYKEANKTKGRWVQCSCSCGGTSIVKIEKLISGHTTSCGCYIQEIRGKASITHGNCGEPLFDVWRRMVARCTNPNDYNWRHYGGRGITVCDRWRTFELFIEDMGSSFQEGLTLDRIDNDCGYSKENCRWATYSMQAHNKRKYGANSKYIGVFFLDNCKKYTSYITVNGKRAYFGTGEDEYLHAVYYDTASEILYGSRPNRTTPEPDVLPYVTSRLIEKGLLNA